MLQTHNAHTTLEDLESEVYCTHQEAESRLILRAHHAMQHEPEEILFRIVDTMLTNAVFVVMLCIYYVHHAQRMPAGMNYGGF